jgi:hypothetical protein
MDATYDIFKNDPQDIQWVESVAGLEQATERMASLNETNLGEYFAYDVREAQIVAKLHGEVKSNNPFVTQHEWQSSLENDPSSQGLPQMSHAYDLFKQNENGERIWIETVASTYLVCDATEPKIVEPFKKSA